MKTRLINLFICFLNSTLLMYCNDAEVAPKEYPFVVTKTASVLEDGSVVIKAEIENYKEIGPITEYGFEITGSSYAERITVGKNQSIHEFEYELRTGLTNGHSYEARAYVLFDNIKVLGTAVSFSSIGSTSISITSPSSFSNLSIDEDLTIEARVYSDVFDTYGEMTVSINSNIDGNIGNGIPNSSGIFSLKIKGLSANEHTLEAVLSDSKGVISKDSIVISTAISLSELEYLDAKVHLEWAVGDNLEFSSYEIIRITKNNSLSVIHTSSDFSKTKFIDLLPPITNEVGYLVRMYKSDDTYLSSNIENIQLPDHLFNFRPFAVLYHPSSNSIYLLNSSYSGSSIIQFDYFNNTILNQIWLDGKVGYSDIGIFNDSYELYLAGSSSIEIYDAINLAYNDRINTEYSPFCVTTSNEGFLIASFHPNPWWDSPIRTFDRASLSLIAGNQTSQFYDQTIRMIPNQLKVISITTGVTPTDMTGFTFSSTGAFLSETDDDHHGGYPLDAGKFRIPPSGEYLVTDRQGAIYDTDGNMTYLGALQGDNFNDFAFNTDGTIIFASENERILVFEYPSLSLVKEISTRGIPLFMERRGSTLIALSQSTVDPETFGVELIEID